MCYAECHFAKCRYAECVMLGVVMLNVVMLSVVAPQNQRKINRTLTPFLSQVFLYEIKRNLVSKSLQAQ